MDETQALFELGAHLGHKKNRLHPKSRRYIYKIINGVSIIDLTLTAKNLDQAEKILKQYGTEGKNILVVASKKIASQFILELCNELQIASVTNKWLPGLLTNFDTIIKNVKKMNDLKQAKANGDWEKFPKHEQVKLDKELYKLEKLYGGISNLQKRPDLMVILDIKKEKNAVKEATAYQLPIVGIADTNSDPDLVTYPVVINDDSAQVVQYVMKRLLEAYAKAKKETATEAETTKKESKNTTE